MEKLKRGQIVRLQIDRLSIGGRGVGRFDGLVIFVNDSAPGDELEVELTLVKKSFAEGKPLRIIKPGASRVAPRCPIAGVCGGCNWQHISYSEQIKQKRSLVIEALRKFSGFSKNGAFYEALVEETMPSPKEFGYRNRIQLHHSGHQLGFFKRGSHEIIDIDVCPITDERITREFSSLREKLSDQKAGRTEVYLSENGKVEVRTPTPFSNLSEEAAGPAFSQVNSHQNTQLVRHVVTILEETDALRNDGPLFDLYAGSGNFTFPAAGLLKKSQVTAVELNAESVQRGQYQASREFTNGRVQFKESDVASFLAKTNFPRQSTVLMDPPRIGAGLETMELLAKHEPAQIIYVSCHPATLARDLSILSKAGYELVSVRPFDMFPQTDHIESVAFLRKPQS